MTTTSISGGFLDDPTSPRRDWQEDRWQEKLSELRKQIEANGGKVPSSKTPLIGPFISRVRSDFHNRPESRDTRRARELEAIPGWSWETQVEITWGDYAERVRSWFEDFEHEPNHHHGDHTKLARWISRQRNRHKRGSLTVEQFETLDSMPGWSWQSKKPGMPRRSFVERELGWLLAIACGRTPRSGAVEGGSGERHQCDIVLDQDRVIVEFDGRYWHGRPGAKERDARKSADLEALGWRVIRVRESPLEALSELDVVVLPSDTTVDIATLVTGRLETLGVAVTPFRVSQTTREVSSTWFHGDEWYERFAEFRRFVEMGGSPSPPAAAVDGAFKVGQWVGTQRRMYRQGRLQARKIATLEGVAGWKWSVNGPRPSVGWGRAFEMLVESVRATGQIPKTDYVDEASGFRLGQWIAVQRRRYRAGQLDRHRMSELTSVPGWWWVDPVGRGPKGQVDPSGARDVADIEPLA